MRRIEELMSLKGRVAVITGGAGYLGATIAEALAEANATIVLVDRDQFKLIEIAGIIRSRTSSKVEIFQVELANEGAVRSLPVEIEKLCGGLDILVNCAAFVGTSKLEGWAVPFDEQETQAWRAAFEVNVTSVFELVQASIPYLKRSGKGTVINIASIYGLIGPDWRLYQGTGMGNPAAYGASKGALIQLSNWLATTLAPFIRVNVITPGGIWRKQNEDFVKRYVERTPLGRMATEEDFKGAAIYLASDLSAYVTGQNLIVDGGWCSW